VDELEKVKWQCRRGSKELDLILLNYLETKYPVANDEEKSRFSEFLKLDDHELMKIVLTFLA
jgi:antitoxin CptB